MMNYLVLDLETTGLNYKTEQITEIAAIKLDSNFQEIGSFHSYVKLHSNHTLSDFIKNLTGITENTLKDGMREEDVVTILRTMMDKETYVVAQHAAFDLAYLSKYGLEPKKFICTRSLTVQADGQEVSASLLPTCERLGIELKNAHTAMADARATSELLAYRMTKNTFTHTYNCICEREDNAYTFVPKYSTHTITMPARKS